MGRRAGIHTGGSSNPHNLVKATIAALSELRDPAMVAQNRGISVEKVFKG
jgi:small subunit ribosomal protein S5